MSANRNRYPEATKRYAVQQYRNAGRTIPDIANEIGCKVSTVFYWLKRAGVKTRRPGPGKRAGTNENLVAEVLRLYKETGSRKKAAELSGVSPVTVIRWARKFGVEVNRVGRPTRDRN